MATTNGVYTSFKTDILQEGHNLAVSQDQLKVCLLGSGYDYTATHTNYSDISGQEISATGYSAGGSNIVKTDQSVSTVTTTAKFTSSSSIAWSLTGTVNIYGCAIYNTNSSPANRLICAFYFSGAPKTVSTGTFTLSWNASGIFTLAS
jgi:hypothetical protein